MSVVGIDLGTTNTVVACVRMGRVHVIADEQGQRLLPSVVSFHPNGTVLVGREAKARLAVDGKNTIASVKRLIGRPWSSPEFVAARQRFAFEMREGPGQGALVVARGQEYTLPEISGFVLKRAKQMAETALGEVIDKAVITVPAHFNELQRASTKVAGRVAGLEVLRIINEPTAAALAYGLGRQDKERIAVYDFGGGTFDCTLLDLSGNVFEVLASAGDTFLGGDDLDGAIADRMAGAFLHQYRYDPRSDPQAWTRLRLAAEQIKLDLSTSETAQVRLREIAYGVGGAHLDLTFGFTRAELEAILEPLVERSLKVTQDALSLARLNQGSFDHAVLVGGSTRIPFVRARVERFFGRPPLDRVNPDEVVAIGAAIQAAALSDQLRRRSIPPPPGAASSAPAAALSGALSPPAPTQHFPTQRGLADVSIRGGAGAPPPPDDRPGAPTAREHTLRIDANADASGADATLSVGLLARAGGAGAAPLPLPPSRPPWTAPLGQTMPLPTTTAAPITAPIPQTAPMGQTAPMTASFEGTPYDPANEPPSIGTRPSFTAAVPGDVRLPAFDTLGSATPHMPPAAGRLPPLPAPPRHPARPSSPPLRGEDPSMTRDFPDPRDLPTPFESWTPGGPAPQGALRPIPPPPRPAAGMPPPPAPGAPPSPSSAPAPPRIEVPTPSRGFQAFGAIDDLPSMMSQVSTSADMNVTSPLGVPSPLGSPIGAERVPAPDAWHVAPQTAPRAAPHVATTAMSPQYPPVQARAPLPPPHALWPHGPTHPSASSHAPSTEPNTAPLPIPGALWQGTMPGPTPGAMPGNTAPMASPGALPVPALGQAPRTGAANAPNAMNVGPRGIPMPPPVRPHGVGMDILPPAVGGFSVPPQAVAPVLVDVTPRALVVEVVGGYCDTIIPRNAKIPCERRRNFATGRDHQTVVRVRVAQGEHAQFVQNTYLGEVELSGIRPAVRGEVQIAVTFELDADGSLRVRATDVQTGQEAVATLQLVGIDTSESSIVMMVDRMARKELAH